MTVIKHAEISNFLMQLDIRLFEEIGKSKSY